MSTETKEDLNGLRKEDVDMTSDMHLSFKSVFIAYTQLTDVEQEVNGVYTYDRKPKFDIKRLKSIFGAPAAIEK